MDFVQRLIDRWTSHGICCPPGVSADELAEFESRYSVQFPPDLRGYFLQINGMGEFGTIDNDFFSFWQLSDVRTIAEHVPDRAERFPDSPQYFLFADHSICLPAFAIRLSTKASGPSPIVLVYTDAGTLNVEVGFSSFTEFVEQYLRDPIRSTVGM